MKKNFSINKCYLGTIIPTSLVYLGLKNVDLDKFLHCFTFENIDILFYVLIVNLILRIVIALRWNQLLAIFPANNFVTTFHYTDIGYFVNNFLSALLGDIIKSYLLDDE